MSPPRAATPAPTMVEPAERPRLPSSDPVIQQLDAYLERKGIDRSAPDWRERVPPSPRLPFDPARRYLWHLETSEGPLIVELDAKAAPAHVSSTVYLTRLGFYDGLRLHRVIPGFMAQGGDPRGDGTGGPGYLYDGEFDSGRSHDARGVVSMANRGPGTDGSQFFVMFGPATHLDGKHTIFGTLSGGRRTLDRIEAQGTRSGRTRRPVTIHRASIRVE